MLLGILEPMLRKMNPFIWWFRIAISIVIMQFEIHTQNLKSFLLDELFRFWFVSNLKCIVYRYNKLLVWYQLIFGIYLTQEDLKIKLMFLSNLLTFIETHVDVYHLWWSTVVYLLNHFPFNKIIIYLYSSSWKPQSIPMKTVLSVFLIDPSHPSFLFPRNAVLSIR